jgi:hypothetical protein
VQPRFLVVAALVAIVAACGGQAPTPTPTPAMDTAQLMSLTGSSLDSVKTADIKVTLSGTLHAAATPGADTSAGAGLGGLLGTGDLALDGTSLEFKVDTPSKAVDITFATPSAIGVSGEVIVVGSDTYLKLGSLGAMLGMPDDGKFHHVSSTALASLAPLPAASASADPQQVQKLLDALKTALDGLASKPTLTTVSCGSGSCWALHVTLTAADIAKLSADSAGALGSNPLAGTAAGAAGSLQSLTLDLLVRQDDKRPAELKMSLDAGAQGTLGVDVTMAFDTPLTIAAPPADQVVEGMGSLFGQP